MKGFGEKRPKKKKKLQTINNKINLDQLIKKAFDLQAIGKQFEPAKYYEYLIKQGVKDNRIFSNYGIFLKEIGKNKEAEIYLKKAISLNPRYANAYYNLGVL